MDEILRVTVVVVMLGAGVAMVCIAGYLQYTSLPQDHTIGRRSRRAALALGGVALILLGSHLY